MISKSQGRLLAVLVIGMVLALNFPALTVVEAAQTATGVAWVPIYLFAVWALGIAVAAWLLERRDR